MKSWESEKRVFFVNFSRNNNAVPEVKLALESPIVELSNDDSFVS